MRGLVYVRAGSKDAGRSDLRSKYGGSGSQSCEAFCGKRGMFKRRDIEQRISWRGGILMVGWDGVVIMFGKRGRNAYLVVVMAVGVFDDRAEVC